MTNTQNIKTKKSEAFWAGVIQQLGTTEVKEFDLEITIAAKPNLLKTR